MAAGLILSAHTCRSTASNAVDGVHVGLDWYVIDHKEDLSAFDGKVLETEVQYVLAVMRYLKQRYNITGGMGCGEGEPAGPGMTGSRAAARAAAGRRPAPCTDTPSKGLILMGHSMGGVVARAALAAAARDPTLGPNVVVLLLTLASPHQRSPLLLQPSLARFYSAVSTMPLPDVPFVSVDPGAADVQARRAFLVAVSGFVITLSSVVNVLAWHCHRSCTSLLLPCPRQQ